MSFKISPPISWSKFWFRDCITTRNAMDLSFCIPRNEKLQLLHVAKRWERELIYFWFVFFYLFALYYALDFSTYLNCWTYVLNLLSSLFFLSKRTFYRPFFQGRKIGGDITKNLSRKALVPHGHTDGRATDERRAEVASAHYHLISLLWSCSYAPRALRVELRYHWRVRIHKTNCASLTLYLTITSPIYKYVDDRQYLMQHHICVLHKIFRRIWITLTNVLLTITCESTQRRPKNLTSVLLNLQLSCSLSQSITSRSINQTPRNIDPI